MPVCTRCRTHVAAGLTSCPSCKAPVMDVVRPAEPPEGAPKPDLPGVPRETPRGASAEGAVHGAAEPALAVDSGDEDEPGDDRLVLLLEEPLPEMAAMIQEFLQNSGIVCVVQSETIGLLYRLPMLGSSFSGARVYVRASDFAEARELVAHFFKKS